MSRKEIVDRLCHQEARRTTSISWPADVDDRITVLVRLAAAAGERTSRAELLAAMISAAETDPQALANLLHSYRNLAADALLDENQRGDLPNLRMPGRRRGPR